MLILKIGQLKLFSGDYSSELCLIHLNYLNTYMLKHYTCKLYENKVSRDKRLEDFAV